MVCNLFVSVCLCVEFDTLSIGVNGASLSVLCKSLVVVLILNIVVELLVKKFGFVELVIMMLNKLSYLSFFWSLTLSSMR